MNAVHLVARIAAPPTREVHGDTTVATIRIGVGRPKCNGQDQGADFFDVITFGAQAENVVRYLDTGRRIAVCGRLRHQTWQHDGQIRQRVDIVADPYGIQFLDGPAPTTAPSSRTSTTSRSEHHDRRVALPPEGDPRGRSAPRWPVIRAGAGHPALPPVTGANLHTLQVQSHRATRHRGPAGRHGPSGRRQRQRRQRRQRGGDVARQASRGRTARERFALAMDLAGAR
jgi:single stranded DNA-binding protein